jgi:hypothetical protein
MVYPSTVHGGIVGLRAETKCVYGALFKRYVVCLYTYYSDAFKTMNMISLVEKPIDGELFSGTLYYHLVVYSID